MSSSLLAAVGLLRRAVHDADPAHLRRRRCRAQSFEGARLGAEHGGQQQPKPRSSPSPIEARIELTWDGSGRTLSGPRPGSGARRRTRTTAASPLSPQHPRDDRRLPRHGEPRGGVVVRTGVRCAGGHRSVVTDRAEGAARRRRLSLRREGRRPSRRTGRDRGALPTLRHVRARAVPARRRPVGSTSTHDLAWDLRASPAEPRSSTRCRSIIRCTCCSLGHHRPPEADRARPRWHHARAPEGAGAPSRPAARRPVLWFTTTGWMMWNYLVSGSAVGATIVLFDGDPAAPDLSTLWSIAADERRRRVRGERAVHHGVPQGGPRTRGDVRPVEAASGRVDGCAAAGRRVPLGARRTSGPRCRPVR